MRFYYFECYNIQKKLVLVKFKFKNKGPALQSLIQACLKKINFPVTHFRHIPVQTAVYVSILPEPNPETMPSFLH